MAAWGEFDADRGLSLVDCIVVVTCRELGAEPLAFDRVLRRAARR